MRFYKIVISNYRQYESMILEFPKRTATDLHIIIASNGIGKTNLLNAIDWCLYGEESHLGNKDDSLTICSLRAIDYANKIGLGKVDVSVKIYAEENDKNISFERVVSVNPNTLVPGVDNFQVTVTPITGNTKILTGDEATSIVDSYLPKKIKQYFFFDGEQLYNYFGKNQDTSHVKDSIQEIAQINVVKNTREHLCNIIGEKEREISKLNPATERLQFELEEYEKLSCQKIQEIKELKKSVEEADDTIDELNVKIAGLETIAEDDRQYKRINQRIEELEQQQNDLDLEFSKFIQKYTVLVLLYKVNKRTQDYIEEKESKGHLPPDINKDLLLESLRNGHCAICQQAIGEDVKHNFDELLNKFSVSTSVSNKLMEIKNEISRGCRDALSYEREKEKLFDRIRSINNEIEEQEEEAKRLYQKISACSSIEVIQDWMDQREKLKALRKENTQKIGSYERDVADLDRKIGLKRDQFESATKGEQRCQELRTELAFLKKARIILIEIETEMNSEVCRTMEKVTFEIFSTLIWKTNTYGRIELNDDYRLRLFHVHGDSCLGSCSAAERELLALAFTLALHKVSHHDSLLFIDTPVGRVSDENRECFAKSLITVSQGKQLILAFTPSEYSVEISKYFDNNASSFNKLGTQDEKETVRV